MNGAELERCVFAYDERGRMKLFERWLGDKLASRTTYERRKGMIVVDVEGRGRRVEPDLEAKPRTIEADQDRDGAIDLRMNLTYDAKGRLAKTEVWRNEPEAPCEYSSSCAPRACTTTITYDSADRETLSLTRCDAGGVKTASSVAREYDAKGRETSWTSTGGPVSDHHGDHGHHQMRTIVWDDIARTATQYDEKRERRSVMTLDELGRVVRRDDFDWAGVIRRVEYRYNCPRD